MTAYLRFFISGCGAGWSLRAVSRPNRAGPTGHNTQAGPTPRARVYRTDQASPDQGRFLKRALCRALFRFAKTGRFSQNGPRQVFSQGPPCEKTADRRSVRPSAGPRAGSGASGVFIPEGRSCDRSPSRGDPHTCARSHRGRGACRSAASALRRAAACSRLGACPRCRRARHRAACACRSPGQVSRRARHRATVARAERSRSARSGGGRLIEAPGTPKSP